MPRPTFASLKVLSSGQRNIKLSDAWKDVGDDSKLGVSERQGRDAV